MIVLCTDAQQTAAALGYIGDRYLEAPYLYVNLVKYGTSSPFVRMWTDQTDGKLCGIYLL